MHWRHLALFFVIIRVALSVVTAKVETGEPRVLRVALGVQLCRTGEEVVLDEEHCLYGHVAKDFDQARYQGQALVSNRLDSVHFLRLICDEKCGLSLEHCFLVMLD